MRPWIRVREPAEWDDPLRSGIGWVSELIEIAGGVELFADRRS
jgi:iron complex transport system substrate-binding protein